VTNLSVILAPVSQESPCGDNLYEDMGYEVQFAALVNAGLGIAAESFVEGQSAASSTPTGRTAWLQLEEQLVDLFRQTKHLDMLYLLALTEGHLNSLEGMIEGVDFTNNLLARHWDHLHPAESEADYEFRQDCLKKLDAPAFADSLDGTVIADGKQLGKFTLGDWLSALRDNPETVKTIEQARIETLKDQPGFYDEIAGRLNELQESLGRLELTVKDNFVSFRLSFKPLKAKLAGIANAISGFSAVTVEGMEPAASGPAQGAGGGASIPDQISSREDVVKTLAKIILYYSKYEPTSPVPAMLERAQRVATMNFKEIVQEFNLTGTPAIQDVLGWKPEESSF
jgi:type VI secretion system protein ImpA